MKRYILPAIAALLILISIAPQASILASQIITAIIPASVPAANKTGTGSLFVLQTAPTITNPVIANISPAADFTITQNSVAPFTSIAAGALVDTLYLKAGKIGIGTNSPVADLDISVNGNGFEFLTSYTSTSASGGQHIFRMARGTSAAPTAVQLNDRLGSIGVRAFGNTAFSTAARAVFNVNASETWTDFAQGTNFSWETTLAGGTTRTEVMRLIDNGSLGIGITAPLYSLDVSKGVGLTGTARFFDQTATTGTTLVTITPGAAQTNQSTTLANGAGMTNAGPLIVAATGALQQLPRTTDPTCAAVGDIGKFWFDNTTTTTVRKACNNVAGTLTWVIF